MMDCARYHARIPVSTCRKRHLSAVAAGPHAKWGRGGAIIDLGCLRCAQGAAVSAGNGGGKTGGCSDRTKTCKACGRVLPLDRFYIAGGNKDMRDTSCAECRSAYQARWRERRRFADRSTGVSAVDRKAVSAVDLIQIRRMDAHTVTLTVGTAVLDHIDIVLRPRKQPKKEE
jgi:hypothetical protein